MSRASDAFVDNLRAAFQFMSAGAADLYKRKLARWNLKPAQWESALDRLLENSEQGRVPELSTIFAELRNQSESVKPAQSLGRACFERSGRSFSIRIYREDVWRICDITREMSHGEIVHLQPHYGEPVSKHIPDDACDYRIIPDDIYIPPEDLMQPEEARKIVDITTRRMKRRTSAA